MPSVIINHKGYFYNIEKENFETSEEAYNRAWYIINNKANYTNVNQLISLSFMHTNKKKGMKYLQ